MGFFVGDQCVYLHSNERHYNCEILEVLVDGYKILVEDGPILTSQEKSLFNRNSLTKISKWHNELSANENTDSSLSSTGTLRIKRRRFAFSTTLDELSEQSKSTLKCLKSSLKSMTEENQKLLQVMVLEAIVQVQRKALETTASSSSIAPASDRKRAATELPPAV